MHPIAFWLAWTAGSITGSLRDPITLLTAAVAIWLGIKRTSLMWPVVITFALTAAKVALLWGWWTEAGILQGANERIASPRFSPYATVQCETRT